ncbi:MAG: DUF1659 domain-containing protein [bacterium]|jgi:hypothetical protein
MAVERIAGSSRLQLRFQTGVDEEGKPIFRLKSYANVKPTAADEDLFLVGQTLAQLQENVLVDVFRHDSATLIEEII